MLIQILCQILILNLKDIIQLRQTRNYIVKIIRMENLKIHTHQMVEKRDIYKIHKVYCIEYKLYKNKKILVKFFIKLFKLMMQVDK